MINPPRTSPALTAVLAPLDGVARYKELRASGLTQSRIERFVATGELLHAGPGVYALPDASDQDVELAASRARRTCLSKVTDLGLWLLQEPVKLHVAAAHGRPIPGCVVHRTSGPLSLVDVLHHCVRCATDLEALVILESAVVEKKCSIVRLREAFAGSRDARARRIISSIDPQAMSAIETVGRYRIRNAGYNFQGQVKVPGMGHLDGLVEGVLGIEFDGRAYHNNAHAFAEDLRRSNATVVAGVPTLHFSGNMVLYHHEEMLRVIARALATLARSQG